LGVKIKKKYWIVDVLGKKNGSRQPFEAAKKRKAGIILTR